MTLQRLLCLLDAFFTNIISFLKTGDTTSVISSCVLDEHEVYRNVTVVVSKCSKCGKIDISWYRNITDGEIKELFGVDAIKK